MRVGTKSLLFGYHQFLLHPIMVAWGWRRLYGSLPRDPRVWVAFVVHDWGYWGKPNMDGWEGKSHPAYGAKVMHWLFDAPGSAKWHHFSLYHSRDMCRAYFAPASSLCWADKLAFNLYPLWLMRAMYRLSGELAYYLPYNHEGGEAYKGFDDWYPEVKRINTDNIKKEVPTWEG